MDLSVLIARPEVIASISAIAVTLGGKVIGGYFARINQKRHDAAGLEGKRMDADAGFRADLIAEVTRLRGEMERRVLSESERLKEIVKDTRAALTECSDDLELIRVAYLDLRSVAEALHTRCGRVEDAIRTCGMDGCKGLQWIMGPLPDLPRALIPLPWSRRAPGTPPR